MVKRNLLKSNQFEHYHRIIEVGLMRSILLSFCETQCNEKGIATADIDSLYDENTEPSR